MGKKKRLSQQEADAVKNWFFSFMKTTEGQFDETLKIKLTEDEKKTIQANFDKSSSDGKKNLAEALKYNCDQFYKTKEGKSENSDYYGYQFCCKNLDICPSSQVSDMMAAWVLILIVIAVLACCASGAAAFFFFYWNRKRGGKEEVKEQEEKNTEDTSDIEKESIEITIDE